MASDAQRWETSIAQVRADDVVVRGHLLSDLVGEKTFTEMIFLDIVGQLPNEGQRRVLDAVLVSLVEHGISPSSMIARMLTSCGTPSQAAVAGGLLSIADWHGGAGEQTGLVLAGIAQRIGSDPTDAALLAEVSAVVDAHVRTGRRFEGFGHPQHPDGDPRAEFLFAAADRERVAAVHCRLVRVMAQEIRERSGKRLPVNVNGAIAAILLDLGFTAATVRGVVIGARAFGLTAHVAEELEQHGRWRHVDADAVRYTGTDPLDLPG